MKKFERGQFYAPILTVMFLSVFVGGVWIVSRLSQDWMSYVCKPDDCTLQQWLSATSGWVGFLAAVVGALFVYHQLREQRRQTAFLLGDGEPTFEMLRRARATQAAVLRIVNWNRRSVVLKSFRIESSVSFPEPRRIIRYKTTLPTEIPGDTYRVDKVGKLDVLGKIPGWLNRQESPYYMDFRLSFIDVGKDSAATVDDDAEVELIFEVFFPDEKGASRYLRLATLLKNVIPNGSVAD